MYKDENLYKFIKFLDKLKKEKRFKNTRGVSGDNSADHTWRLTLMLVLIAENKNIKINLLRAIKISLIHDVVEIFSKDIPRSLRYRKNISKKQKLKNEYRAIKKIVKLAPNKIGVEIEKLWEEYATCQTKEARIVASLDKIEGLMTYIDSGNHAKKYSDYCATYANKYINNTPELISFYKILQKDMEKLYKKNGAEWKSEYSI